MRKKLIKILLTGACALLSFGLTACNEEEHAHEYTVCKYNETHHWQECICGEKKEYEHSYEEGICTECGLEEPIHTLVYYTNGGEQITASKGTAAALRAMQLPKADKEGYTFEGWYLDKQCTQAYTVEAIKEPVVELYAKYSAQEYTVALECNYEGGYTYTGALTQTVSAETPFSCVTVTPSLGYAFDYYEVNGVRYQSNVIDVPFACEDVAVKVHLKYATYELPIISVTTEGSIDSKEDYTDMQFTMENCEKELEDIAGGIRLRGNSTMYMPKKPYRIKFDKKQSLFGLEKAKSWVLLADYLNPTGMRNHTALTLGNETDGLRFTPSPHKINLYINGEFLGLYTLCEQVQENEGRMDIEMETDEDGYLPTTLTDLEDYNFFICMDQGTADDVTFFSLPCYAPCYAHDGRRQNTYEMKYPERESFSTEEQFNSYVTQLKAYMGNILTVLKEGSYEEVAALINVESLVDYYIIDSIMLEWDHYYKSFNMYYIAQSNNPKESGKLSFGPIWDYDYTINRAWSSSPNDFYDLDELPVNQIYYLNDFFDVIRRLPELQQMVKERYNTVFKDKFGECIESYDLFTYQMKESLELNNQRWYADYDYNLTAANLEFLEKYFRARKAFLDEEWKLTDGE